MTEFDEIRKKAIYRLDIVQLFMMRKLDVTMFTRLYNAGDLSEQLLEESGLINAEELNHWVDICMEVGK